MTGDLLVRLLNARDGVRQATAFGLLALVGIGVAFAGYATLSSTIELGRDLYAQREIADRLKAVAAMKPVLLKQAERAPSAQDSESFLQGESEALVRSNLQAEIGAIAAAQGANLISISNVSAVEKSGVRYLGVGIDLSGTVETVHNTIFAIETSAPLVIQSASVWLSGGTHEGATQPPELTAQLQVYGALKPDIATSASGVAP